MKKTMLTVAMIAVLSLIGTASAVITDFGYVSDYAVGSGNSFMIGGIEFSNFTAAATALGAQKVEGEQIAISGVLNGDMAVLRFNGGWSANSGQWADTTVDFLAVSDTPILSNALTLTAYSSTGGATISVTENVTDTQLTPIADKLVIWYSGDVENKITVDTADYPAGTNTVIIHKDIFVGGGDTKTGHGHISGFTQGFLVPEPITLALLGLGGLVIRRKR